MDILGGIRGNVAMGKEVGLGIGAGAQVELDGVDGVSGVRDEQRVDGEEIEEGEAKVKGDLVKERSTIADLLYLRCKSILPLCFRSGGKQTVFFFNPMAKEHIADSCPLWGAITGLDGLRSKGQRE